MLAIRTGRHGAVGVTTPIGDPGRGGSISRRSIGGEVSSASDMLSVYDYSALAASGPSEAPCGASRSQAACRGRSPSCSTTSAPQWSPSPPALEYLTLPAGDKTPAGPPGAAPESYDEDMEPEGGRTRSTWMDSAEVPGRPSLADDLTTDVCVVGAGIAGLTTAYLLTREARKVVVLDDGPIGGGETGRTTAHLASALDDRFYHLEHLHGEEGARLAAQSHCAAIDRIESIVAAEGIDCDFTRLDGYLFVAPGESADELDRELEAARRAGLEVESVARAPMGSFDTGRALRFGRQGQFHPLRYLAGLARAILAGGGQIYSGVHVEEFESGPPTRVKTATGRQVTARALVVATNTPVNDRVVIHTKQAAYRTYAVGIEVPAAAIARALYWDTADPYHYVRLQSSKDDATPGATDILIVGGEDHRTGQGDDDTGERWTRLERWTRERFPMAGAVRSRWSGQVEEPADSLAFIGRNPLDKDNVFIATGDSGHGMTHGTIAGMLITDLVLGRPNPWAQLYDPSRRTLRAAAEYASELAKSNLPFGEWLTPGEVDSIDDVPPGEGRIIRHGLQKLAVYRDAAGGKVVSLSARCPHLGCVVEWNGSEKTWDCPCHGSRYAPDGRVLNGPALSDLSPVAQPELARRQ